MKPKSVLFIFLAMLIAVISNAQANEKMDDQKEYIILILMNATPKWLALSRSERSSFFENKVVPVFHKVSKTVKVKLYDSEYFHSRVSDFIIADVQNLEDYKLMIELLRDTKIYSEPYFEIVDIITGQQNMFEFFNEKFKQEGQ